MTLLKALVSVIKCESYKFSSSSSSSHTYIVDKISMHIKKEIKNFGAERNIVEKVAELK
jgi:hypothetical protein